MVTPEKSALTPFVEFARQAAMNDNDLLSLTDEVLASKHLLSLHAPFIDGLILRINTLVSKENLSREDLREYQRLTQDLQSSSAQFHDALIKASRVVKSATEIEAIKATRFDAIQLMALLRQIPVILDNILNTELARFVDELPSNGNRKAFIENAINRISTKLKSRLDNVEVVHDKDVFENESSSGVPTEEYNQIKDQLAGMIETVPMRREEVE